MLNQLPDKPIVSIVVPSFNQGKFIRATLDSILNQNYSPLQIIVIDGGSRDETVDVLKSFSHAPELQWISEPDRGVVDAVNKGFQLAQGDVVGIQSSDDTYLPNAISQAVDQLKQHSNCGLVYGDTIKIDAVGNELSKYVIGPFSLENILLMKSWIPQPSAFFRREMLDHCGGWNEAVPYAADTDLWLRIMFQSEVRKVDAYWSQRRIHDAQRDTQVAKIARDYQKMLELSKDIQNSSPDVKKMAEAAKHLIQVRYNASGSDWKAAWHLWQARKLAPQSAKLNQIAFHASLPARRLLSKWKRSLFGSQKAN